MKKKKPRGGCQAIFSCMYMHLSQDTHYNVQFKVMRSRICTFGVEEATQLYLVFFFSIKKTPTYGMCIAVFGSNFHIIIHTYCKFPLSLPKAVPWFKHLLTCI
jgi:hypothetical protein